MKMRYPAVAAVVLAAACSSSDTTAPVAPVSIVGSFALRTINGDTVPTLLTHTGGSETDTLRETDMISDVYTFNSDQSYSEQTVVRVTDGASIVDQTQTTAGTYTQNGATLTLTPSGGAAVQGALSGAALTVSNDTATYVYHKIQST